MKKFFTIGEFAALRHINVNSLRYYEKIGILSPAYTDPQTKYRYYAAEQLLQLDIIRLAIDLEMPLKTLKDYSAGGAPDNRALFSESKAMLSRKIADMQDKLSRIEYSMRMFDDIDRFIGMKGFYRRPIQKRAILAKEFDGNLSNVRQVSEITNDVIRYAGQKGISVIFPMGVLLYYAAGEVKQYIGFHALATDGGEDGFSLLHVGEGEFDCFQKQTNVAAYRAIADSAYGTYENRAVLIFAVANGRDNQDTVEFQSCLCEKDNPFVPLS